ncbi:hypothetical protein Q4595_14435 [Wenyingzhuangia sp. 1_MG-2023]|nr:hypothetical protein [Wenyingzhuangia sp. 1_MG-2023]
MRCDFSHRKQLVYQNLSTLNMDLGTAIVGIVCVTAAAMPFVLTNKNKKKKEKQLLNAIKNLAEQQHCQLTQHQLCGAYAIGIDTAKNFLFFQLNTNEGPKQQYIDLSTIKNCNVSSSNKIISNNNIIDRLDLELISTDKNKPSFLLEFYSFDLSYQLSGELQSIEQWSNLIQKQLSKNE